jgi:diacylglycerol kinase (ATP)
MIMKTSLINKKFSLRSRMQSFHFAFAGVVAFFKAEHNAWLHLAATILALTLAILLHCTYTEILFIILVIASVWVAELFNTAIEKLADLTTKETHPEIKFIKDVSAAAVLITAIAALLPAVSFSFQNFFKCYYN